MGIPDKQTLLVKEALGYKLKILAKLRQIIRFPIFIRLVYVLRKFNVAPLKFGSFVQQGFCYRGLSWTVYK